jgi:ABC-type glycerol-3-phosphate transport system substrate-binding protein
MEHKHLSRRNFLRLSATTMAGAALVACVAPTPQSGAGAEPAAQSVDLSWWSFDLGLSSELYPHGKWEGELAETYMAENPGVTIEHQALTWDALAKVSTSIATGTAPNLILRAGHGMLTQALEADVAVEVELEADLAEDLPEGYYERLMYQGKNYLIPFYVHAQGPLLNISIAQEAGAEDLLPAGPTRAWDFDQWLELMKACTRTRDDGTQTYGYVINATASNPFVHWPEWLPMWNWGADTTAYDEASQQWGCALDSEEGISWLQFMQDLYFVHGITPNPSGLSNEQRAQYWEQGQDAYYPGPALSYARRPGATVDPETLIITDPMGFDWMFVQNPTKEGITHQTWGGPTLDVSLLPFRTDDESTLEPTIDFGHWLVNSENQQFLAQFLLPVRVSALEAVSGDPLVQWMFDNWIPNARERNTTGHSREEAEVFQTNWQRLYLPTPPEEVAASFCNELNQAVGWA